MEDERRSWDKKKWSYPGRRSRENPILAAMKAIARSSKREEVRRGQAGGRRRRNEREQKWSTSYSGAQEIKLGDSEGRTRDVVTVESRLKPAPPRISVERSELGDGVVAGYIPCIYIHIYTV